MIIIMDVIYCLENDKTNKQIKNKNIKIKNCIVNLLTKIRKVF